MRRKGVAHCNKHGTRTGGAHLQGMAAERYRADSLGGVLVGLAHLGGVVDGSACVGRLRRRSQFDLNGGGRGHLKRLWRGGRGRLWFWVACRRLLDRGFGGGFCCRFALWRLQDKSVWGHWESAQLH